MSIEQIIGIIAGTVCGLPIVAAVGWFLWFSHTETKKEQRVQRDGTLFWGYLVQANNVLFQPGNDNAPGQVVFTFEKSPDGLAAAEQAAARLAELKTEDPADKTEESLLELVRNESYDPGSRKKLPAKFTGGRDLYLAHVWIWRERLPKRRLTAEKIRCVALPGDEGEVYHALP